MQAAWGAGDGQACSTGPQPTDDRRMILELPEQASAHACIGSTALAWALPPFPSNSGPARPSAVMGLGAPTCAAPDQPPPGPLVLGERPCCLPPLLLAEAGAGDGRRQRLVSRGRRAQCTRCEDQVGCAALRLSASLHARSLWKA
jgi:hypothetical protein